jgi:RHS repeat-associated protein
MTPRSISKFGLLSLACLLLFLPRRAVADATASCTLTFNNLTIAPSAGTVVFAGTWTAESFSQAQNSLGELSQQYVVTNGATATTDATATFAAGHGDASPLTLSGTASSSSIIPGSNPQQAISEGQPDVYNSFMITGGTGTVNVAFSVNLTGLLNVSTDSYGSNAQAETIFNLTVDGNSTLFSDNLLSMGPNSTQSLPVFTTLSNVIPLQYGTSYFVFAQPDAETMALTVPEPSALVLVLAGCSILALGTTRRGRRRSTHHMKRMGISPRKYLWMSLPLSLGLLISTTAHAKYAGGGGNPPSPGVTISVPGPIGSTISLTDGNLTYDPVNNVQSGTGTKPCPPKVRNNVMKKGAKTCEVGCKNCNTGCPAQPPGNQGTPPGNSGAPPSNPTSCSNYGTCSNNKGAPPTHGISFKMNYNSYNADGSRAQIDTGMGYGWTQTYNDFLFTQVGNMFRYDGSGKVTKFTRGAGGKYSGDTGYFQTLVKNPGGTYTITDKYGTAYNYASIPNTPFLVGGPVYRLTSIVDRNRDSNILAYTSGNLTSVSDTYGRKLTFTYNPSNKLTGVTDPLGRTTTYTYDPTGRQLTKSIDPEGKTNEYNYNFMYQITQQVDRDGRMTRNLYAGEKPTLMMDSSFHKWFGLNNSSGWSMNTNQLSKSQLRRYVPSATTKSDGNGNLWNYSYDSNGYITQAVAPDGATTTYAYDPQTLYLAAMTDPNGNPTTYQYDSMGNRIKMTDALGDVTTYTYETNFNQVTSMTDPKGRVTMYQYDTHGNRIGQIDPLGQTNSWTYDTHGNVVTETDKLGNVTTYQYDSQGNRTNVTDAIGNVTSFTYDSVGNLVAYTDANAHTSQYQYDGLNRLLQDTDPVGNITQYSYDSEGNLTNMVDRNGNTTSYQYDLRQRRVGTTDALGQTTTTTYDGNNNVISMTDADGNTTIYQYDVQNRVIQVTDADSDTTSLGYDAAGNVFSATDANGHVTTYTYDALNRVVTKTDADGELTQYQYDMGGGCPACGATPGSNLVTKQTDANGNVAYYNYDELNRQVMMIRKVGSTNDVINPGVDAVTTFTYDAMNNVLSATEPDGNTTLYRYDSLNRQTNMVNAAGDSTTTLYDGVNNLITAISPNGNITTFSYDAMDRETNRVDHVGPITASAYDAEGNLLTLTDGNGNTTTYTYDALYRRTKTVDALGNVAKYFYDPVGNLLTNIDRDGNVTTYAYDPVYRQINTVDALGNVTQYQYDAVGNRIDVIDAGGNVTQYQYDPVNRPIQETYADFTTRTYSYDAVGNRTNRTDQIGQITTYTYDPLYHMIQRTYPSGTNDTFGYDLSGRMITGTRGGWTITYAYDGANRLTNTTQNGRTITYGYDIPGRTLTNTYPSGRMTIQRMDFRMRKIEIDDSSSPPIVQYTYDAGNRVLGRAYRNGTTSGYTYDNLDRVVSIEHSNNTDRIAGFGYEYDNEGHKRFEEKRHDTGDSECYGYDAIYRLTDYEVGTLVGTCVTGVVTQTQYVLDPLGNWTSKTTDAITQLRAHNSVNELTAIDSTNLTYDANGNLLYDAAYTYTYDEENRLTQVTRLSDSAIVGQYQYDATGRRVQQVANPDGVPTTTRYFYDDSSIMEDQDGLGTTLATYVYGNYVDEALTMDRGGQTYYYYQDASWSPAAMADSTGANVVERYHYDAYGSPTVTDGSGLIVSTNSWGTAHSAIGNPYLYTGRQLDEEAGLYFYRARYYDTLKGRFLQRDPLGYVDGMNLYEYVKDSPMNATDPDGRKVSCLQVSGEVTVGGGFTPCAMYCEDGCGNWGVYAGIGFNVGLQIGAGAQWLEMRGLNYVWDVEGKGWSVQGSVGVASGSIQGNGDGVQGGGGGAGMGLKAGLSASFTLTGKVFGDYSNGECDKKRYGSGSPCCQATSYGTPIKCIQGSPGYFWRAWNCPGGAIQCKQSTGTCNGTKCSGY